MTMIGTPFGFGSEISLGASEGSSQYIWIKWVLALTAP